MAKIFAYKNYLCFDGLSKENEISDAVINDPFAAGQLGVVCEATKCEISKEAIDLLSKIKQGDDSIGDVDIFESDKGVILAWFGSIRRIIDINNQNIIGSRDYDVKLLKNISLVENEVTDDLKQAIKEMSDG